MLARKHPEAISNAGALLIKHFEGLRLRAYSDVAGHRTIGYGHAIQPGERFRQPISLDEAEALFQKDVAESIGEVSKSVHVDLNQNQFDALVSLVFNIGGGAFSRSTLLRALNAGDYQSVGEEFLRWNKASVNGRLQEIEGLTRRRRAERALFLLS